jgi:addiction module RelB/DinJ family antitoxin
LTQSLIQLEVDEDFRKEVDSLFNDLGLSTPTAIMIFLKQAIKRNGMPFDVVTTVPTLSKRDSALAWKDFLAEVKKIDDEPIGDFERVKFRERDI